MDKNNNKSTECVRLNVLNQINYKIFKGNKIHSAISI